MIELACPVRACNEALVREGRRWSCARGHAFDVSKSGYCNLLQPNERRSRTPGDSIDAAKARRRLFERGVGAGLTERLASLLRELGASGPILDAGCGEGHHLSGLCARLGLEGIGVDISAPAIDLAARRDRERVWIVSNADRRIPVAGASVGTVLSVTARVNPDEFARILRPGGHLVLVLPAGDDLAELRERVLGERTVLARLPDTLPAGERGFDLVRQEEWRETIEADAAILADLLLSTYRGQRVSQQAAAAATESLRVTHSRVIEVRRKSGVDRTK